MSAVDYKTNFVEFSRLFHVSTSHHTLAPPGSRVSRPAGLTLLLRKLLFQDILLL